MSDGSGSHCRIMSESPRQFNIFTLHVTANVSVAPFVSITVDVPHPNRFTCMLSTFGPSDAAVIFQNKVVTLNNWNFAVFDCALDSLVVVLLVLCLSHVSFSQTQKAHTVLGSALLLSQEFCHNQLDPQRLAARTSILQLVRTTFVNRLTFVRPQARTHEFLNPSARTHEFLNPSARTHEFCNHTARTHEFLNPSARTHSFCEC